MKTRRETNNKDKEEILCMRKITEILLESYGNQCLLTGERLRQISRHHLQKREHGGKNTVDNMCLLLMDSHRWLHSLEHDDIKLYNALNEAITLYKMCMDEEKFDLVNQYETEIMPLVYEEIKAKRLKKAKAKVRR